MKFKKYLEEKLLEAVAYNVNNEIPLSESVYRRESKLFFEYFNYLREKQSSLELDDFGLELVESDLGKKAMYEGVEVPLDLPFMDVEEEESLAEEKGDKKNPPLNKPKRGGAKKFYVYVKDPSTGNIKKVSFGAPGMSVGLDDPERRKSFAARHNCDQKKDKTKPGYWSCNLPRYAKSLGMSGGGNFYW